MKNLILFAFIALIAPATFAQIEQASESLASSTDEIQLNGKFSFTYNQNEYFVVLSPSSGVYQELDSQENVIGYGAFNHADICTVTPESTAPNGIMNRVMQFKVISKTQTSITIEVSDETGDSGTVELQKI